MVLTVHCVYSRYPFLRKLKTKTAAEVASALWDVILDMGVVPMYVQSDMGREFVNEMLGELLQLLGSAQIFSSAVHPQSQGITERSHREMTALLSIMIQGLVISRPQEWDLHLRTLECRLRDKRIGKSGVTPRAIIAGWFSVTPLQSALGMVEQIPADMPINQFVRDLVRDHQEIAERWEEWRQQCEEKEKEQYNEREARGRSIEVGELVLLQKGEIERNAGGKTLPKADGPYEVLSKPSDRTAVLGDPFSKAPILDGRSQTVARLVRFEFPKSLLQPTKKEKEEEGIGARYSMSEAESKLLQPNDVVVHEEGEDAALLVVDFVHQEQKHVTGRKLTASGPGAWSQRVWKVEVTADSTVRGQVTFAQLLCRVELEQNKLTAGSLELMKKTGVIV